MGKEAVLALGWAQRCGSNVAWSMPTHPSCSSQVHSSLHSKLMPSSLVDFAFLKQDLSPVCLFLLTILREVGGEQPSGSLCSGCLFGRRQIAGSRCLKKNLNLNGKAPSKKIKPQGAQVEEIFRENLDQQQTVTVHKEYSPPIDDRNICLSRLLALQYYDLIQTGNGGDGAHQNK